MFLCDLTALASALGDDTRYRKLRTLISQADSSASAMTDYRRAGDALAAFTEYADQRGGRLAATDHLILSALFNDALIHYVRAAAGESHHRKTMDIRGKWSPELKEKHTEIVALRNDAVAHFGPGPNKDAYSAKEALVYAEDDARVDFRQALVRANFRQRHLIQLIELVAKAQADIVLMFNNKRDLTVQEMMLLASCDEDFRRALFDNQFDPYSFFINADGADAFMESLFSGAPGRIMNSIERPSDN